MSELDGVRAIVTGGATGIGGATAQLLQSLGADVAVLDRDVSDVPGCCESSTWRRKSSAGMPSPKTCPSLK